LKCLLLVPGSDSLRLQNTEGFLNSPPQHISGGWTADMMGDETEYLQPVLGTLPSQRFKPLKSTWVAALLILLIVRTHGSRWLFECYFLASISVEV